MFNNSKRADYEYLLYLADQKLSNRTIANDTFEDSASVYERIFLSSENEVQILARGIRTAILDNLKVIDALTQYLNKANTKLHIILRDASEEDRKANQSSKFITTALKCDDAQQRVQIDYCECEDTQAAREGWLPNIGSATFGDDRMYRYRYFPQDYKKDSNAKVCFNAPDWIAQYRSKINDSLAELYPDQGYKFRQ